MASIYRYPLKAFTDTTDYLQIDVVRYKTIKEVRGGKKGESFNIASKARSRSVNQGLERIETILLPIPSNVSDSNGVKYGESELNNIAGAAIGAIGGIMETGKALGSGKDFLAELQKAGTTAFNDIQKAVGGIDGVQGFVTRKLASSAAGIIGANITPSQILARTQGEILNPNIELLFGGPTLRSFRFQYKMMPRNQEEGEQIKQIIRCFKRHMASKLGSGNIKDTENTFLRTPDVFELRYRQGAGEHKYLHKFKQCFLESINVNYTGEGVYSTYEDGTPVSMIMDLSFKEIEPIYDLDQQEAGGVGY
jgi:hypothetical protein